jgi:tRNA pseudouridine38-40 synthase
MAREKAPRRKRDPQAKASRAGATRRWRLDVAYDGTAYHGFARQPDQATVQEELEKALSVLTGHPVIVAGAGRTDAGVHALGQVVAFDEPEGGRPLDRSRLLSALSALLPSDIRALEAAEVPPGFDPRRDALAREYLYSVAGAPTPLLRHMVWEWRDKLDLDAMRAAAGPLIGPHDFSSFCLAGAPEPRVRELMRLDIEEASVMAAPVIVFRALGSAFLHGMVRAIVGTLIEVGRARRGAQEVPAILEARDRRKAGPSAPARGLVLGRTIYDRAELAEALSDEPSSQLRRYVGLLDSQTRGRL